MEEALLDAGRDFVHGEPEGTTNLSVFVGVEQEAVPTFMQYALFMEYGFNMNGGVDIQPALPGMNANVHTNQDLNLNGSNYVAGFGSYVGNLNGNASAVFEPVVNPGGTAAVQRVSRIVVPAFDASDYQELADEVTNGNAFWEGHMDLGTRDEPQIHYISGNLIITGDVTTTGYGIFLVEGNIVINGDVVSTESGRTESHLAFYTSSNVDWNGTHDVTGQIFANQNVNLGNGQFDGSIATRANLNFNGQPQLSYRPAAPALTTPIWN